MIGNTLTLFREATDSVDENIATIIVGIAIVVSVKSINTQISFSGFENKCKKM